MADREQRQRSWVRRATRIGAGLVVFGVLLIAAALAFSQTDSFRNWLRGEVVSRVNASLNGQVSIGALEGNLFGGLVARDVRVQLDGAEVVAVQRVAATYDPLMLLRERKLLLSHLTIEGVALNLRQDANGWNVARLAPQPKVKEQEVQTAPGLAIRVDDLEVRDGSIEIARPGQTYKLQQVGLRASANIGAEGRKVSLKTLSFTLPERQLRIEKLAADIDYAANGDLAVDGLVFNTDHTQLHGRARVAADKQYDVDVDVGNLSADELQRALGITVLTTDLHGKLRLRGPAQQVVLDGTQINSDAGSLTLSGNINLSQPGYAYDLTARLDHLDAARLLGPSRPDTDLTGTLSAQGSGITLDTLTGNVVLTLDHSRLRTTNFEHLSARSHVENRRVQIDALAQTSFGTATVKGSVDQSTEAYDLQVEARQFDPAPLLNRGDFTARINGTANVRGRGFDAQHLNADLQLNIAASQLGGVEIRRLDAAISVANNQLTIRRLALDSNVASAAASGTVGVGARGSSAPVAFDALANEAHGELHYEVRISDLRPVAKLARMQPMQGALAVTGNASGNLSSLELQADINGRALATSGARLATLQGKVQAHALGSGRASAVVSAQANDVAIRRRRFAAVQIDGKLEQSGARNAADLMIQVREDQTHNHRVKATIDVGAQQIDAVLQELVLQIGADTWRNVAPARITRRGARLSVSNLELSSPRGSIAVSGEAGSSGNQDLTLMVQNLDVAPLVGAYKNEVQGRLSGRAHLTGSAQDPTIEAQLSLDQATIEKVAYEKIQAQLDVGKRSAVARAEIVQSGNGAVIEARVPVQIALSPFRFELGDSLSGTVRANDVDLAFLDPLIAQVSELRGRLTADLTLGGSLRAPQLRGPVSIHDGHVYVVASGVRYQPVELQATFDSSVVQLESLRVGSKDGSLTGSGQAQIGERGAEINIQLDDFPLFDNKYGEGRVSGWLWLGGTLQAPIVEGGLDSNGLVLLIPERLPGKVRPPDPTIKVIGPAAPPPPEVPAAEATAQQVGEPTPTFIDRASVRIAVNVPHNAWLRRSDANIELRGWTTTWKKPGEPLRVAGQIDTVRGWYTFQGRKFNVEEGQVTLTGQDFNPLLNVVAVYQSGDYLVRVRIGGTLTTPSIKLESEPALDQADILSILVFGRPANDLNQGESRSLQQRAIGVASGYVAGEFRQSVANALGLDNLEVEPSSGGLANTSVSVGKYLTEDIFVSLSRKFAQQSVEELRVEYFFNSQWSLQSNADTQGDSGLDIYWRHRY